MFDPHEKLKEALREAQSYMDLAIQARDRGEREFYERMVERYLSIALDLFDQID